jgi:hypothetical protein
MRSQPYLARVLTLNLSRRYGESVSLFQDKIDQGSITSLDELKSFYKTLVKQYHPDLNGGAPPVDFDRLKQEYADALKHLERLHAIVDGEPDRPLMAKDAFLDEFRNLVARGFPINVQAASKNRAYAASVRVIGKYLEARFDDPDFFFRANRESRLVKRRHPRIHWYVMQIFWNLGDWRITGFDFHRRIFIRHLKFIRETLEDEGAVTLLQFLDFLAAS